MANFLYVDNSNVWIEGMHVAAVQAGLAPSVWQAHEYKITSPWRVDFGKLMEFAGGQRHEVGRAVLYGSRPPDEDSVWAAAKRKGFELVLHDRNASNREKKIDTSIATDIIDDSHLRMKADRDEITLVAGDSDYVPTVERLVKRGFKFHVVFWNHAARELRDACTSFTPLDDYLQHLASGSKNA